MGVGRPKSAPELLKIPVGYKLPRWMVEWLRAQPEAASVLIERALTRVYLIESPKGGRDEPK